MIMTMMQSTSRLLAAAVLTTLLAACATGPTVAPPEGVIALKRSGADEATQQAWASDPSRTFDLTDVDIADLVEADISEAVVNTMLRKSEAHHAQEKEHENRSSHSHEH
jgi:hypothetical protein